MLQKADKNNFNNNIKKKRYKYPRVSAYQILDKCIKE